MASAVAVPVLWFMAGLAGAIWPGSYAAFDGPRSVEIGLIHTAIHTDLLLPLDAELRQRFGFAAVDGVGITNPDSGWLLVGWGAQDFYTSAGAYSDVPLSAVLKGITGDHSVLRLEAWYDVPLSELGAQPLQLTAAGYQALLSQIEAELGPEPRLLAAPGLSGVDAFYGAASPFNALQTCNSWIGQVLRGAGVPLGAWTPTPQALQLSLAVWR